MNVVVKPLRVQVLNLPACSLYLSFFKSLLRIIFKKSVNTSHVYSVKHLSNFGPSRCLKVSHLICLGPEECDCNRGWLSDPRVSDQWSPHPHHYVVPRRLQDRELYWLPDHLCKRICPPGDPWGICWRQRPLHLHRHQRGRNNQHLLLSAC